MAKPAFLRYLPARLKPLGNPAVWAPLTIFVLLSAFLWEYHRNPDWFNRQPLTSVTPDSRLTPEEEARLSEIDNLDVLLNGSRVSDDTEAVTSQINPDAPIDPDAAVAETDSEADDSELAADYPIPGAPSSAATIVPGQSSLPSSLSTSNGLPGRSSASTSDGSTFNFGDGLVNPTAPSTNSALAEALNRREAARAAAEQSETPATGASSQPGSQPTGLNTPLNTPGAGQATPSAQPVPGAFSRTTPAMSPPVGTTGYQIPETSNLPTFNVVPQQPTRNPYSLPSGAAGGQFAAPAAPTGQAVPAPATVAPPAIAAPTTPAGAYTAPTSIQPDQGPAINPRR